MGGDWRDDRRMADQAEQVSTNGLVDARQPKRRQYSTALKRQMVARRSCPVRRSRSWCGLASFRQRRSLHQRAVSAKPIGRSLALPRTRRSRSRPRASTLSDSEYRMWRSPRMVSRAPPACLGLNAGGSYGRAPCRDGPIDAQFPDVLLMGRQHGKSRKRQGAMSGTCASLRADAARAVNGAYAKVWLYRGRWQAGDPADARG